MEWNGWKGKNVFVRTKHGKVYSGLVESINQDDHPIIFISLLDKFGKQVMLVSSEIIEIKEEER